jgi:diaminohydroxyphosphoribosylaminopyrimidine deaminase / 5-amino-6-(5-phosphoribosylamino)uracil reductase
MKKTLSQKEIDFKWIQYAFLLSQNGDAAVLPNPRVGAVYVKNGEVLAEGWHEKCGGAHAERIANIKDRDLKASTLYVSLEPCSHFGKTPPCVDYIIQNKIKRVVFGLKDPGVGAGGAQKLKEYGIEVDGPIGCNEMLRNLEVFCCNSLKKQTYITAKWAMTLDGKIASNSGSSQWISGEASRKDVHRLRSEVDGIMVGAGTLIKDNPSLDVRYGIDKKSPRPIIWDPKSVTFQNMDWYERMKNRKPIVFLFTDKAINKFPEFVKVIVIGKNDNIKKILFANQVYHVLVEGGAFLLGSLFDNDFIDQSIVYIAPKIIGGLQAKSPLAGVGIGKMQDSKKINFKETKIIGEDICILGCLNIYNPNYEVNERKIDG